MVMNEGSEEGDDGGGAVSGIQAKVFTGHEKELKALLFYLFILKDPM